MFALVDCNNFYASCERLFQPKLKNIPVLVLSNNDGCVIARSNEAKALGVKMGQPFFECRDLVKRHGVAVFSANFALYGDLSARVMSVLQNTVSEMEVYSIDEAFLHLEKSQYCSEFAGMVNQKIQKWVGLPVSVGLGPTKTLAKVANSLAKADPLNKNFFVMPEDEKSREKILKNFPLEKVWGIGRQWSKKLKGFGLQSAFDVMTWDDASLRKHLSVFGLRMAEELRGVSCLSMDSLPVQRKGVVTSRTLAKPQSNPEILREIVAQFTSRCAEKIRDENLCAGVVTVFLKSRLGHKVYDHFTVSHELDAQSDDTRTLVKIAGRCFDRLYQKGRSYKKIGVTFSHLVAKEQAQRSLWSPEVDDENKATRLMQAMDQLNHKMGRDVVKLASCGTRGKFTTCQSRLSPRYTTQWAEIPKIA